MPDGRAVLSDTVLGEPLSSGEDKVSPSAAIVATFGLTPFLLAGVRKAFFKKIEE